MTGQAPPVAPRTVTRFVGLEGLRTIGVIAVLLAHTGFISGVTTSTRWGSVLGHLEFGVAIFFLISAFLLYRPFVTATLAGRAAPSTRVFLRRRLVRIFPAYWLALVLLIAGAQIHIDSGFQLLKLVTLTHIYTERDFFRIDVWVPTWTLATELTFYGFLVLYAPAVRRIGARLTTVRSRLQLELIAAGVLYVFAFVWRTYVYYGRGLPPVAEHWLPGTIDVFAFGIAAAAVHAAWSLGEPLPKVVGWASEHPNWCAIAATACYLAVPLLTNVATTTGFSTGKDAYLRNLFQGVCALLLLLPVAFGDQSRGLYRAFVQWRPMVFVGFVSYGVYLWHDTWLKRAVSWTGGRAALDANFWLVLVIAFTLSVVCGTISYRAVERPLLELDARHTRARASS